MLNYLREAAGDRRVRRIRLADGVEVNYWAEAARLRAVESEPKKERDARWCGLLERHLQLAWDLLDQEDRAVRASGLGLVMNAITCAANQLKDGRLAAAVTEAFLLPGLDSADSNPQSILSRPKLLQYAALGFGEGKSWERLAQVAGEKIRLFGDNRSHSDRWRTILARALEAQGRREEAVAVLRDIHDPAMSHLRDYHLEKMDEPPGGS